MTDIIFSFDVEDYINPAGADAVLRRRIGYGCPPLPTHDRSTLTDFPYGRSIPTGAQAPLARLTDGNLLRRFKLQSRTIRLPKGTARMLF
ncbi:MAG: hypothetical protein IJC19_04650 [Clostridia bacterium]|nr:hypothetical protein [Clostridia bacterium]